MHSDEEKGDSTLTVRRIVRGGIVYVEEDDDTLCLAYHHDGAGLSTRLRPLYAFTTIYPYAFTQPPYGF